MAFDKVLRLNNSAAIGGIREPGGVVTALASVCAAPLPLRTATLRLVRFA